jgi:hypothetical protein
MRITTPEPAPNDQPDTTATPEDIDELVPVAGASAGNKRKAVAEPEDEDQVS